MNNCDHQPILINSRHGSDGNSSVSVCRVCGEISVIANKGGVHFSERFSLYGNYELIAASQAHRKIVEPGDDDPVGEWVWKPFDFANKRLYQVIRTWDVRRDDKQRNYREYFVVAAGSPTHAAAIVEAFYEHLYDTDKSIVYHHAEGRALNIHQPLEWTKNGIEIVNYTVDSAFVPGEFRCSKCQFRLSKRLLSADSGAVGVDTSPVSEACPNDGSPMLAVTWREAASEAGEIAASWAKRAHAMEEAWPEGFPMPAEDDGSGVIETEATQ